MEVIERLWEGHEHISAQDLSTIAKERWIFDFELCTTSRFAASASFRERFLRDQDCSMRTPTRKKKVYAQDPRVIQQNRDAISDAEYRLGLDRVWKMDETGWKDIQQSPAKVSNHSPSSFMAMTGPKSRQSARFPRAAASSLRSAFCAGRLTGA
jgi:hypothetical protein